MSDIKFGCEVCGGHIVVDETAAGAPLDCPHCANKITVPVVAPLAGAVPAGTARSRPSLRLISGLLLLALLGGVGAWWVKSRTGSAGEEGSWISLKGTPREEPAYNGALPENAPTLQVAWEYPG